MSTSRKKLRTLGLYAQQLRKFQLLIGHLGRKAYGWYFGYPKDPYNSYEKERSLKSECKSLFKQYFEINKKHKGPNKMLKKNIFEFRQSWK